MKTVIIAVFVLAVAFAATSADPLPDECAKICPLNYLPVCVEDEGKLLNFGNACALEAYNCEHKKELAVKFNAECPQETV